MTYEEFKTKWANRPLYETPYDYNGSSVGKIHMYRDNNYQKQLTYYKNCTVIADVFDTPKYIGWKDDKQKKEFYKDAKSAGVSSNKTTKNEWYRIIDIKEL